MATVASPPTEQRVVLHNIAWETYESLLADHVSRSAPRFTYDHGELEILGPSTERERDNRTLAQFVEMVAMELSINFDNVGSMTFKREDLQQGFEPDSSFYIQNELHIRGKSQIDLMIDPPPDLVIEIEITRQAIPKLPLYASMGVPEVWRSDRGQVAILRLQENSYSESIHSAALPPITSETLTSFLAASRSLTRIEWLRQVREWAAGTR